MQKIVSHAAILLLFICGINMLGISMPNIWMSDIQVLPSGESVFAADRTGSTLPNAQISSDISNAGSGTKIITMQSEEGFWNDTITPGQSITYEIGENITTNMMAILSLSNIDPSRGKFEYLTLQNKNTGLVVCPENANGFNEGGYWEWNRVRFFTTTDTEHQKYNVIVSTPANGGYNGSFTINVKIVKKLSFVHKDTKEKEIPEDAKTYCISSCPEYIGPVPRDVQIYNAPKRQSELGENGYYLQRSPINRNADIYWEHINEYGRKMKFGVLLWNNESKPLTVTLNSRSIYGNETANGGNKFFFSTKVWIERAFQMKNNDKDETDHYYAGFNKDNKIVIPAYNPKNPSESAKWICLHTANTTGVFSCFNGVMDISITDDHGNEYTGQKLYCDTYVMDPGSRNGVPFHEITRQNVAKADRAFGDTTYRGSANSAVLEADIKGTTVISSNHPYNFVITGFDVPALNENEEMTIMDVIWDKVKKAPVKTVHDVEDWTPGLSDVENIKQINERIHSCNYGVIYKVTFDKMQSDRPIKGKVRYTPKITSSFENFSPQDGYPTVYVAVYDQYGHSYEAALNREGKMSKPYIEETFSSNVISDTNGQVTYYIVVGGVSYMPLEVSFEN